MFKKILATISAVAIISTITFNRSINAFAANELPTGVGLSAHALNAYIEGWQYVWGGTSTGAVDCSGLIATYHGVGGNRVDMLSVSPTKGLVKDGIPRIHGLGLHQPKHVGIYVGSNASIDARSPSQGMVYQNAYTKGWVEWFKIVGVSYPSEGWVMFNNHAFFYENGEYVINTTRVLDNDTYTFNEFGYADHLPPENVYQMTDYSNQLAFEELHPNINCYQTQEEQQDREGEGEEEENAVTETVQQQIENQKQKETAAVEKAKQAAERKKKKTLQAKQQQITAYNMTLGSTGLKVKEIQALLKNGHFFTQEPNGYYDKKTALAVAEFQEYNNMTVTGEMNFLLYQKLTSPLIMKKELNNNSITMILYMKHALLTNEEDIIAKKISDNHNQNKS